MNKKFVITLFCLLSIIGIWSCQDDMVNEANVENQSISKLGLGINNNIPYTDSVTLSAFSKDSEVIDFKLARKIALLELDATGFREEFKWDGHKLSKQPVVIYGFDSKPKYYEYIVKDAESNNVGAVTIDAKKKIFFGHKRN